jgi:hypothetical protein
MEKNNGYRIVRYSSRDCPEDVLRATADFYTYIFNNASDHFFVHRETGAALGRSEIPELAGSGDGYVPNTVVNRLHTEIYDGKGYGLWHHGEVVLKNIKRKLGRDGQLVLLINVQRDNQIGGFSFGRRCTLMEALSTEEWLDPYVYSDLPQKERFKREGALFLKGINDFLANHRTNVYRYDKVALDTPVYCWNAAGIAPGLQGKGHVRGINDLFFRSIPKGWGNLLLLGEASDKKVGPDARQRPTNLEQFQRVGGAETIMELDRDLYIIGAPVETFVEGFIKKTGTGTQW